jgi:hypothetical protein
MVRRLIAVVAGSFACQVSMIVCLTLALGLIMLPATPPLLLLGVAGLLLPLPGLVGGALAGFLTDRFGWYYGGAAAALVGEALLMAHLYVVPTLDLPAGSDELPGWLYLALVALLGLSGIVGGRLGHRHRLAGRPASGRPVGRRLLGG